MAVDAVYFDGETARDYAVSVRRSGGVLEFQGPEVALTQWSIAGLHPIDPPTDDQPFRITHDNKPGARLVLRDRDFIHDLVSQNSHLKGGYSWRHLGHVMGWTVGGLAALAGLGYLAMTVLPQQLASLLPQGLRDTMGEQVVNSIVGSARKCDTPAANSAISRIMSALAQGGNDLPPVSIGIYDMELVNAFAAGGGRVVLTKGLINGAKDANEVAGVLAHELGHVYHLHPEAQLVRISGLQILISVVSGGGGSDVFGNAAGLAALLRYNRAAEREADTYARSIMEKASVDPTGLKRFFERVLKIEGKPTANAETKPSALDRLGNVLSTHPDTEERIKEIVPLPADQKPVDIMSDAEWDALKKACG